MNEVVIYSSDRCAYCVMAKRLLDKKGVAYQEINVDSKPGLREELIAKTQRRTVPQIFIGSHHVGGFDDLYDLERSHQLDVLLNGVPASS